MVLYEELKGTFCYRDNIMLLCYLQEMKGLVLSLLLKIEKCIAYALYIGKHILFNQFEIKY